MSRAASTSRSRCSAVDLARGGQHHTGCLRRLWWLVILTAGTFLPAVHGGVAIGDPEAKVLAELGTPTGTLSMGPRKRATYPAGSITYVNGVVTAIDPRLEAALSRRNDPATAANTDTYAANVTRVPSPKTTVANPTGSKRSAILTGVVRGFPLTARSFENPSDYFTGDARRAWAAAMAADPDEKTDPTTVISYAPGSQSALLYVPPSYDGSKPYGLFVDVRPHEMGDIVSGYDKICADHNLIWVSPDHAGNDEHTALRCALALDALATVKQKYRVADSRVYVGGFSGGGATAGQLAILFPEYFRGAIIVARGVRLQPSPAGNGLFWPSAFPYLNPRQLQIASRRGLRVAFITGPGDMNHEHVLVSVSQWKIAGFEVHGFDVQGMGHEDAPPNAFAEAIRWIEERP